MKLFLLADELSVWKLPASSPLPQVPFFAAIRTGDELTLVTQETHAPKSVPCERCWQALKVAGPLDFSLTGVVVALAVPLAEAQIPIFVLSTFDTDYILVKKGCVAEAVAALQAAGHTIEEA